MDNRLDGIPSRTLFQCHVSAEGVTGEPGKDRSSCNAIFPLLRQVPDDRKDLVLTIPDAHGDPDLAAPHGVCAAPEGGADAYDWGFCWKVWDALRGAAFSDGRYAEYALGDTPRAPVQRRVERRHRGRAPPDPGLGADPALTYAPAQGSGSAGTSKNDW